MIPRHIIEPARETSVRREVDVLVVGGGAAGIAAAASAAATGARVLLVERYGFLGGTLTAVTLGSICGLYGLDGGRVRQLVNGFADELIDRMRATGGIREPQIWLQTASLPYDPEAMKRAADDIMDDRGVEVLFHTRAVSVVKDGAGIDAVVLESVDGRWACAARQIVDCSGDGDVAALAGAGWDCDPSELQFPTTMMRFGGVRTETLPDLTRPLLHAHLEEAVRAGHPLPRTAGGIFAYTPGIAHLNITRISEGDRAPDPLSAEEMSRAEAAGRRMAETYLEAFRRFVPGFEDAFLLDTGAQIGVRESRRIRGDYMLTGEDVLSGARFSDAIGCCAWPMEEHGADRATRWVWLPDGVHYQIPFRCLLPRGVDGLIVAGRCVSASHAAQASLRVAGTCFAMGQAAGTAAAIAGDKGTGPRQLPYAVLQEALLAQGAFLGDDAAMPAESIIETAGAR